MLGRSMTRPAWAGYFVYGLIVLGISFYAMLRPAYWWDVLPYTGLALEGDGLDSGEIHQQAYALVKQHAPPGHWDGMVSGSTYHDTVAADPESFAETRGFYRNRVLYIGAIKLLGAAGVPYPVGSYLLSVISFILVAALMLYWLTQIAGVVWGPPMALLILLGSGLQEGVRLSNPDLMAGVMLMAAVYQITEGRQPHRAWIWFWLAILTRPDSIIMVGLMVGTLHLLKSRGFIARRTVIAGLGLFAITYITVMSLTHSYGWWTFYAQKFVAQLAYPASQPIPFDMQQFLRIDIQGWIAIMYRDYRLFLLILLTTFVVRSRWGDLLENNRSEVAIIIALALTVPIRLALYPLFLNRMYMIPIAMLLIMCVKIAPLNLKSRAANL